MSELSALLSRQLHFVCGKGGVGKSVVACSLARAFRAENKSVLLVQVNTPDAHSRLLGTGPIGAELREVEPGFFVVDAVPAAAMKEYALMTLKFEALYRTVFENRLTKAFLRFMPSLTELTIQGKIWFHAEERTDDGRPRFERIVIDCPSTGHGLKFLRTARIVHDASRVGPMAEKTRLMAETVEDPKKTALHVVALPEELPVNEARDLVGEIRKTRTAPLGITFLNQRLPRLFDETSAAALAKASSSAHGDVVDERLRHLFDVAERRKQRELVEREARTRLEALEMPLIELPMLLSGALGPAEITRFAKLIERAAAARGTAAAPSEAGRTPAPSEAGKTPAAGSGSRGRS